MSEEERQETEAETGDGAVSEKTENAKNEVRKAKKRIEEGADKAMEEFDQSIVDLLAWLLDTETRARIYVYLRQHPDSTSEEVASGTGLYPSTVREALAELHEEGTVDRGKRESEGAGNNPYEYEAISPSELVSGAVGQVQNQLNAVVNLDNRLRRGEAGSEDDEGPVTITVGDTEFVAEGSDGTTGDDDDGGAGEDSTDGTDDTDGTHGTGDNTSDDANGTKTPGADGPEATEADDGEVTEANDDDETAE